MVMLQNGLNRIRDLHATDIDYAWMGTSGTAAAESQTGLIAPVVASKVVTTYVSTDKQNVFNYTLVSTSGTGQTYREFAIMHASGTIEQSRVTFTGLEHTEADDIVVRQTIFYRNP